MAQAELFETGTVVEDSAWNESGPLKAFQKLGQTPKWVAYALAWLHEPISMSELTNRLAQAGIRLENGKRIPSATVKEALRVLKKAGLVRQGRRGPYQIDWDLSHYLAAAIFDSPEMLAKMRKVPSHEAWSYGGSPTRYQRYGWNGGELHAVRDLREKYLEGDAEGLIKVFQDIVAVRGGVSWEFVMMPVQGEKLKALPLEIFRSITQWCLYDIFLRAQPAEALQAVMLERAATVDDWRQLAQLALYRVDWETMCLVERTMEKSKADLSSMVALETAGGRAFLEGDDDQAVACFEKSMALWRKATRKRKCCPPQLLGYFFLASLLRRGKAEDVATAQEYAVRGADLYPQWATEFAALRDMAGMVAGRDMEGLTQQLLQVASDWIEDSAPGLSNLFFFVLAHLLGRERLSKKECVTALETLRASAERTGAKWLAAEASSLRDAWIEKPSDEDEKRTADLWSLVGPKARPFSTCFQPPEPWERAVLALETLGHQFGGRGKGNTARKTGAPQKQLVWCLLEGKWGWHLQPIERSISAKGKMSKGRKVALKRLKEQNGKMEHLTDQDRRVTMYIRRYSSWGSAHEYELDDPRALLELAGHPLLFSDEEGRRPLELVKVSPRLSVGEAKNGSVQLALTPKAEYKKAGPVLICESSSRYLVLDCQDVHVRLHELLENGARELPAEAKERVVKALGSLSENLAIESDEGTLEEVGIKTVEADCQPVLRLFPHGEGLRADLFIRPLKNEEMRCAPGEGKAVMIAKRNSEQVQVRRDLKAERAAAEGLVEKSSTLAENLEGGWSAVLQEPVACLNLLEEIHGLDPEEVVVEWPEGQPFRLHSVADTSAFNLSLGGGNEWLTASGTLPLDDEMVLTMRQLVDLMADSSETPGYVQLADGQFLALTRQFRRQLEDLQAFSQPGKGEKLEIHPLAALALDDLANDPDVKAGAAWKKQLARLRKAGNEPPPQPPSTLQAELRPYQLEGYRWLRRLADWGMGACLADDMGLGKTVQALALLLDRAPEGPALVVAPTSVAGNWLEETTRFAPTLRPIIFGRTGDDREAILKEAGPFDLVITSYGLLQSEADAFAAVSWHTVILDEAQAIKNRTTKRSRAAMKLEADFRVITTGTPVENRLSELHNLFSFLNPGLLGSWDRFRKTFADPIERQEDREARERLRRLIRPFILRRLKADVLRDLPSRTEIGLRVELAPEEAAFYEALRRKAVEDLEQAAEGANEPGQAAIRILAELTRLRRACCHPKLVAPDTPLGSAKLRLFAETLQEILAGNHKVLVFSQFVDHLRIIRGHLESEEITYQYLDGSTPAPKRQKAVRDFQSGKGDVFLISLKAGGFGLNLTAADYVIHMDPWWNPAAEDQASDRAHRIGQTRPVTIYRLITAGTIEEKIVDLHHRKRELADSILEGTDSGGNLSPDELLKLLRDEG